MTETSEVVTKRPGRPEKPIDWELVDELLVAGSYGNEIAAHFNMTDETFYNRIMQEYGVSLTVYSLQKKQKGDSLIRKKQYEKALEGDNTMLVWLGKNRLKQAETPVEISIDTSTMKNFTEIMNQLTAFQLARKTEDRSISREQ